jgi:hypothetical protein
MVARTDRVGLEPYPNWSVPLAVQHGPPQDRAVSWLVLVFVLVVVVGLLGMVFWNVLRAEPSSGPALGTNNPYPYGVGVLGPGEEEPTFLPTPVISEAEEFRRNAGQELSRMRRNSSKAPSRSWMEEPGALERAGLVDAPAPQPLAKADAPRPAQKRRRGRH